MTVLSVTDASRMAGVSRQTMYDKIKSGELDRTPNGIELQELIRVYPNLKPLANLKLKAVKKSSSKQTSQSIDVEPDIALSEDLASGAGQSSGTVELLIRELEWNKELLEKTNQQMAKQLAEQRAMIADQARRLDEKDRFWARQIEIAQSLLPAPEPQKRRKIFGLF